MTQQNEKIKVGDIYYDIYGYDATLVDFFEITRVVSDKTLEFRQIEKTHIADDKVSAKKGAYKGEAFKKRINKWGRCGYSRWNGEPKYVSPWGSY